MKVRKKLNIAQCVEENYEGGIAVEEIKVGDYIRINGIIGKVEQIGNSLFWLEDGSSYSLSDKKIKHSKNIIDLIECGDYVNGREVKHIAMFEGFPDYPKLIFVDEKHLIPDDTCENDEIRTILTHEQFEQKCYKLD